MSETLNPRLIFELLHFHVPAELRPNLLVVGSLAAAFHHRDRLRRATVNTKDCDGLIQPAGAVEECKAIATKLIREKWRKADGCFPQLSPSPAEKLRAIRLWPPDSNAYFLELLAVPPRGQEKLKEWIPIEMDDGWYGLPSFRFMGVAAEGPITADNGIRYAAPWNMALANLLSHPTVGDIMIEGGDLRGILRSAKDLGRVLGLAHLAGAETAKRRGWTSRTPVA